MELDLVGPLSNWCINLTYIYRAQNGISRRVPGLKYAHIVCDSWTRLNVLPAKIMQVILFLFLISA